jgi:hypothetical protein
MTNAEAIIRLTVCYECDHHNFRRKQCFTEDEGGPLGIGLQGLVPNRLKLHWSRAIVVSVEGKGKAMTLSGMGQEDERK